MAESIGQSDIRGIDIDKIAKGFADEENIFKRFCTVSNTSARELRWYQKTAGFISSTTTSGMTTALSDFVAYGALPTVVEQTWTRQTSYVKKFMLDTVWIPEEDIMDSDIDLLLAHVRDVTRAVERRVDRRIYNILTENQTASSIGTSAAVGTGWDDTTNGNPLLDVLSGSAWIRSQGYDISNLVLLIRPTDYKNAVNFFTSVKGSSVPQFSSGLASGDQSLFKIATARVVVSENVVADSVCLFVPQRAITWKAFAPVSARVLVEEGVGRKVRVWEEGEALLTDPKSVFLITNTNG